MLLGVKVVSCFHSFFLAVDFAGGKFETVMYYFLEYLFLIFFTTWEVVGRIYIEHSQFDVQSYISM
jgi:hypothetical protein